MTTAGAGLHGLRNTAAALRLDAYERASPARPEQVGAARRFVARLLAGTPVAVLCVSELASNCVSYSGVCSPAGKPGPGWTGPGRGFQDRP
jgi:hypothetical protein